MAATRLADDSPDDSRALWLLVETNVTLGDLDAASRAAEQGERLRPDLPHWGLLRAYLAWRNNDTTSAAGTLESIIANHPDNALAHAFLGALLDKSNVSSAAQP